MNKKKFRVVFNKLRGVIMVTAEHVRTNSSSNSIKCSTGSNPSTIISALKPIALSLMCMSGLVMLVEPALADIIADPSAPGNQKPIVSQTANGLPLVNIQTPSAAGVSRNVYKQFDVKNKGAILNNSNANVQTQLGGWVQGNPHLAGGTAKIILNEVNSQNPSLLNGFIEVAGSRAQVVIANPAGISCSGCGFINANRATLTTGTPIMNSGNLLGYRVGGGEINFSGDGMDASQTNFTDVIARAVNVNAGIWANALNITTGTNQVNVDSNGNQTNVSPISPDAGSAAPAFAVDVAVLGGMYAGKIHMVGTEAGLGVRNASAIGASVGSVSIAADGLLQNTGSIGAKTNIQMDVTSLESDGDVTADGNITISLDSDYTHTGTLRAGGQLDLQTSGNITNQSTMLASQSLSLSANNINNAVNGEIAGLETRVTATNTVTNRGLIDGVDTLIKAETLSNTETGSVFGNHLAIQLVNFDNDAGAVIAARGRLDIGASTIENRSNGLIFSAGDLAIGGTLDSNHHATGATDSLINENATIEALGNMQLAANDIQNLNAELTTALVVDGTERIREVQPEGWPQRYDISRFPTINNYNIEKQPFLNANGNISAYFEDYTFYDYTATTRSTHVISSAPGQILSGGDMTLLGNVTNSDSQIIAGRNLDVSGATIQNLSTAGQQIISYSGQRQFRDWDGDDEELEFGPWVAFSPASKTSATNLAISQLEEDTTPTGSGTSVATVSTPVVTGSLFQPSPDIAANYLIETNPRFANYRTWLSSDYMLSQLAFDPATMQKRLGDGFYEQRLIREQVAQLTGRRFLDGFASDEAQYQALMNAGVTVANAWQLIPGVALTAEQIAQLTSDIIWLVEETVTMPDDTTTQALVPKVYVRLQAEDLDPTIGLMAGNQVTMDITGNLTNSATIAGRTLVAMNADNIQNLGGQIQADVLSATVSSNLDIQGGALAAKDALLLQAGNDITVASTATHSKNRIGTSTFTRTNIDRAAGLYITGNNGVLVAAAGNDINLLAAQVINAGENGVTLIDAGNNLNLGIVKIAEQNNSIHSAKDFNRSGYTQEIGTTIQTEGDIQLNAGQGFVAHAANVNSTSGGLNINADNDIRIESGSTTYNSDIANISKRSGTFSSRTKEQRDTFKDKTNISSTLSADSVALKAGDDIAIHGSNVVSDSATSIQAAGDVSITSATNNHLESHYQKTKRSGISTSGASVSIGSQELMTNTDNTYTTQAGSTVGSVAGDVVIEAGKAYTQKGSDVLAPAGDIDITAQQVDILAAQNRSTVTQETKFKQSGLTISISNPVVSAIQTAQQMSKAASQTSDSRMQALAAGTTALAVKNAFDAVQTAQALDQTGKAAVDGANQVGGVNLSISIGSSKSSSTSTQTSTSAEGSKIVAGGDINIKATETGKDSDINVVGSQIKADNNITLKAEDEINLIAAKNSETLKSKNKNSSASVGVSVGTSGFAVTASASKGKGKANGTDVSWTETTVEAGNKVSLESGTDTKLIGAEVRGEQVVANVGTSGSGNLTIQSLQDTSTYDSKQKSAGVSVSVPIGVGSYGGSISASSSKINADYASVNEQAGIFAGDEGFQVSVAGNTNLKGGVLASTEQAIIDNKNNLTTETLKVSDIKNKAEYEGESASLSAGVGLHTDPLGNVRNTPSASAGMASDQDKSNSVTVSGISGGTVSISDNSQQQTFSSQDAPTTIAMLNRDVHVDKNGNAVDSQGNSTANTLTPIFDQEKLERELNAGVAITQAFSQVAPKAVGDYAASQYKQYLAEGNIEEAAKWADGGIYRVALHTLVGGLSGNLEGALGAGTSSALIPIIGNEIAKLDIPEVLKQSLVMATATAIGASTGGQTGAGTALSEATNNYLNHQENLKRQKASLDCGAGDTESCNIVNELNMLDRDRDAALREICEGNSTSDACRGASTEMRQALATYFALNQANKPATDTEFESNALPSGYSYKDELQSYVPIIKISNPKLGNEALGNDKNSQSPSLYNGDPYGVINRNIHQNYVVVKVGDQWGVVGTSGDQVYTEKAGVNGMQNSPIYAPALMGIHVEDAYADTSIYTLNYVSDNNFFVDLLLSLGDKLGGLTTSAEAEYLSQVLQNVQSNGQQVDWVAHSRGGVIFTQAANISDTDLSNNTILFHAGANNEWVTQSILNNSGIKYGIGSPGNEQPPYKNSGADLVPNIVGFNGNPIQIFKSILAIPDLSKGPLVSPHTLPFGYIVAPPRYTTPYSENAP